MALPATIPYQLTHTYQGGMRAMSQYPNMGFLSQDLTVDARSGLPTSSKDAAEVETQFEYDALGRLTWVKPVTGNNDGWTEYEYSRALSAFNLAKVTETQTGTPTKKTEFLNYDAFGRPGTIRPADGSAHDVTFVYRGTREVARTTKIGTSQSAGTVTESSSTTTERGPAAAWSSGAYVYDGAGNITKIGPAWFTYDKVNRLTAGNVYTDPLGLGAGTQQGYTYDPFGKLTAVTGANARNTPTAAATNRLTGGLYDGAGNLTSWNGAAYQYDRFNQMLRMTSGSQDWAYVYTADDERIWSYNLVANVSNWTLRDLSGQVLREYANENGTWTLGTDYIHRNGQLLAAETRLGRRHFHLDHLGTPRLITNGVGYKTAYHVYYPFGEEATAFNQDGERMKFTGHERDLASPAGAGDDLDYMHARHCSPVTGRFLSVDPAGESFDPMSPQSWNRYSYVHGNPLKFVDPTGKILVFSGTAKQHRQLEAMLNAGLHGYVVTIDASGKATMKKVDSVGAATKEQTSLAATLMKSINNSRTATIALVNGDSSVRIGNYNAGAIDLSDIASIGDGPGVNSQAILAHEIEEQAIKQFLGLRDTDEDVSDYNFAHDLAISAQDAVSGWQRGPRLNLGDINSDSKSITLQRRGMSFVTVTIEWRNGNVVKVTRW